MRDTVVMYLELCLVLCLTPHCMYILINEEFYTHERWCVCVGVLENGSRKKEESYRLRVCKS